MTSRKREKWNSLLFYSSLPAVPYKRIMWYLPRHKKQIRTHMREGDAPRQQGSGLPNNNGDDNNKHVYRIAHLEISVAEAVGVAVANREEHLPHQLAAPLLRVVPLRSEKGKNEKPTTERATRNTCMVSSGWSGQNSRRYSSAADS